MYKLQYWKNTIYLLYIFLLTEEGDKIYIYNNIKDGGGEPLKSSTFQFLVCSRFDKKNIYFLHWLGKVARYWAVLVKGGRLFMGGTNEMKTSFLYLVGLRQT